MEQNFLPVFLAREMQELQVPLSWPQTAGTSIFSFIPGDSIYVFDYSFHTK